MSRRSLPRVLIYKRTHPGDPTPEGVFGFEDCMGSVRTRRFDAVIGVGGTSSEPRAYGIDRRLNWVGVGAHILERWPLGYRGPLITFDRFILLEDEGPNLSQIAPALAQHVYGMHRRVVMSDSLNDALLEEVAGILKLPPNRSRRATRSATTQRRGCFATSCLPKPCKKRVC
jgi:hypothetical protein